jgi:hypothetical protein
MTNNLYRTIRNLTYRQKELKRIARIIMYDQTKKDEYEKLVEEYDQIDKQLILIVENFNISPKDIHVCIPSKFKHHLNNVCFVQRRI